jgi:UDP-N-acetylglucosamine acyltransferase
MATVHPTAIVDPTAHLDQGATVGPYCVVGPNVVIGSGTTLLNHITVQQDTVVGRDNVIYPYAFIGGDPQDRKYRGEKTILRIGHRNTIREMVTIHRGTGNGGSLTEIGSDCLIMGAVHIAHDCVLGDEVTIANNAMLAGHIHIDDGANIGGGAGLHHFTSVGSCAFVAAMARVPKDVPPYMIVEGSPAEVRAVNIIGMTRRGVPVSHIDAVKEAHKRLYRDNGAAMAEKIISLRDEYRHVPEVCRLCDFLAASAEGVHGRALENKRPDDKWQTPIEGLPVITQPVTLKTRIAR